MEQAVVNKIPVRTWSNNRVNQYHFHMEQVAGARHAPLIDAPEALALEQSDAALTFPLGIPAAVADMAALTAAHEPSGLRIRLAAQQKLDAPVFIRYDLDAAHPFLAAQLLIDAQAGSEATIVVEYHSEEEIELTKLAFTQMTVAEGARIKLIYAQRLSAQANAGESVQVDVAEDAEATVIFMELGAAQSATSCDMHLRGDRAQAYMDTIFLRSGKSKLDLNYRMQFNGQETYGHMNIQGAVAGQAHKATKCTLDFISGCSGTVGREEEHVISLSPEAVSVCTPLLLCSEDNVEGQHAASTGRPDPDRLFYLMSRGLNERQAKKLLLQASLAPILDKLPGETLREMVENTMLEISGE